MAYYGVDVREDELMKDLKVSKHGVSVQNMISVAGQQGFQVEAKSGVSLETLKRYLDEKHPVIVLVQAWAERYMTLEDWMWSSSGMMATSWFLRTRRHSAGHGSRKRSSSPAGTT